MLENMHEGLNARSNVYLFKEYFCEMCLTCVSSKLCEFISFKTIGLRMIGFQIISFMTYFAILLRLIIFEFNICFRGFSGTGYLSFFVCTSSLMTFLFFNIFKLLTVVSTSGNSGI